MQAIDIEVHSTVLDECGSSPKLTALQISIWIF